MIMRPAQTLDTRNNHHQEEGRRKGPQARPHRTNTKISPNSSAQEESETTNDPEGRLVLDLNRDPVILLAYW